MTTQTMSLQLLMQEYMKDEQLKIDSLPWIDNPSEAYQKLEDRIALIESIAFEAKSRLVKMHGKKRELEVRDWTDKNVKTKLTSPKKTKPEKERQLTKLEKTVSGMIELGQDDSEIIELMSMGNKYEKNEIWRAIETVRGPIQRTNTKEQQTAIDNEEKEDKNEGDIERRLKIQKMMEK